MPRSATAVALSTAALHSADMTDAHIEAPATLGNTVRYWDFTHERYATGRVTAVGVRVTWRPSRPLGVQIDGCLTRSYADVEVCS